MELAIEDGFAGLHLIRSTPQVPHPTEIPLLVGGGKGPALLWHDNDRFYSADLFYPSAPEDESDQRLPPRRVPVSCLRGEKTSRGRPHYTGLITMFDNLPRRSFHTSIFAHRSGYPGSKSDPLASSSSHLSREVDLFIRDLMNLMYYESCCQDSSDREKGGRFLFINAWNEVS